MNISLDDLRTIPGIGPKTIQLIKDKILQDSDPYISQYDGRGSVLPDSIHLGDCLYLMNGIPDKSVDMVLCDLPYGTTGCSWDSIIDFNKLWSQYNRIVKDNGAIVLFGAEPFTSKLINSNIDDYKYSWIWEKEQGTGFFLSKKQPLKNHENIMVFYKAQPTYNPQMRTGFKPYKTVKGHHGDVYGKQDKGVTVTVSDGDRYPLTVLKYDRDTSRLHPTQKPVPLLEYLVKTYTNPGDVVLDNTMGVGSTGQACINTDRRFIGIELDPIYFDISKTRLNFNK